MHPVMFSAFERLCSAYTLPNALTVVEIGATATSDTLLNLPCLANVAIRTGINISVPAECDGYKILQANAHHMPCFADESIDLVLCNSVLEHDPQFWLTLSEIHRILRPGGIVMIGVPGYAQQRGYGFRLLARLKSIWPKFLPGAQVLEVLCASTPTLPIHNYPGDYYRFSGQAMREVFFKSFEILTVETLMSPPRIIGVGRKLA